MNFDSLTCSLSQISHLISSFSKRTLKQNCAEISNLVEKCGIEAERHLFRCLFSVIEFNNSGDVNKLTNNLQINYLNQELNNLSSKLSFLTTVCTSIENPLSHQKSLQPSSKDLLYNISKTLSLSKAIELLVGIALKKSNNSDLRKQASEFVDSKLPDFVKLYTDGGKKAAEEIKIPDLATEALHVILTEISRNKSISAEQRLNFFATYRKENQQLDRHPTVLLPLVNGEDLYRERVLGETAMPSVSQVSLADILLDHGYTSCSSLEECHRIFEQYNQKNVSASQVARCIVMMAVNNSSSLDDVASFKTMQATGWVDNKNQENEKKWNMNVFIEVVKDTSPQITARDVVSELDQAGIVIQDMKGLHIIIDAVKLLSQGTGESTFDLFLKNWKNFKAQFSIIELCIRNNQIYCFGDHIARAVNITSFKQPIDDENKEILLWKSLDLVECLLNLSEKDRLRSSVENIFQWPMKNCPDLLTFSLLQATAAWPTLKSDCILNLLQVFVGSHPNSVVVFQEVWSAPTVPEKIGHPQKLITRSMSEWFKHNDQHEQCKLSRILELAQETKTLSTLLNERPFAFVIDLAALASKREYLKLDKWVTDKLSEHGQEFLNDCVKFLKRHFPELPGQVQSGTPAMFNFLQETLPTMLTTLQKHLTSYMSRSGEMTNENTAFIQACCNNNIKQVRPPPAQAPVASTAVGSKQARPPTTQATNPTLPPTTAKVETNNNTTMPPGPAKLPPSAVMPPTLPTYATSQKDFTNNTTSSNQPPSLNKAPAATSVSVTNSNLQTNQGLQIGAISQSIGSHLPQVSSSAVSSVPDPMSLNSSSVGPIGPPAPGSSHFHSPSLLSSLTQNVTQQHNLPLAPGSTPLTTTFSQPPHIHPQMKVQAAVGNGTASSHNQLLQGLTPNAYQQLSGLSNSNQPSLGENFSNSSSVFASTGAIGGVGTNSGFNSSLSNKFDVFGQHGKNDLYSSLGLGNSKPSDLMPPVKSEPGVRFNPAGSVGMTGSSVVDSFGTEQRKPGFGSNQSSLPGFGLNPKPQTSSPKASSASDGSCAWPDMNRSFSKEIEDRANSYFQRIYNVKPNPSISVDEILELLQKFKESDQQQEREVFNCMMRNLFEEYRFFPQYPDKELKITACLFGGVIQKDLVAYMPLGIALRYVLEALRKPKGHKMFQFGIAALDRFKTKLKDYPQYCQHINTIPHFENFPAELKKFVEYGKNSEDPQQIHAPPKSSVASTVESTVQTTNVAPPNVLPPMSTAFTQQAQTNSTTTSSSAAVLPLKEAQQPSIAKATNIDTLLGAQDSKEKFPPPPDSVQDKVAFIFNNLSMSNIGVKADELRDLVNGEHLAWLSQYLVLKRVSIEPNFHYLYSNFVDTLDMDGLGTLVSEEVFRNIRVLLKFDKTSANFSDRSLLKNLGHFLGIITIAKNIPILHKDLDLKALLWEANFKGSDELLYVVPFVAKIFESVGKSRIFKLPNPYTQAILSVLKELHNEVDLKLNLKFEIEVLCKNLNIILTEIVPSVYLKDSEVKHKLKLEQLSTTKKGSQAAVSNSSMSKPNTPSEQQSEIPRNNLDMAPSQMLVRNQQMFGQPQQQQQQQQSQQQPQLLNQTPQHVTTTTAPSAAQQNQIQQQQPVAQLPKFNINDINAFSLPNCLQTHVVVKEGIPLLQQLHQLQGCIRPAIERSIQDVIQATIEKAMKLAVNTSEQIVRKDFALDPDEFRMQSAAHQMVRNLAAGMSLTYCREQLLSNILTNLKNAFLTQISRSVQTPNNLQSHPYKEMVEQAATIISSDNIELACCFIQKTCVDKAVTEIDKRLMQDYELRKQARQDGRRFCDPHVLTYQAERMSEPIRLKVGGVTNTQMAVYDEFGKCIPGFQQTETTHHVNYNRPVQANWQNEMTEMSNLYDRCLNEIEQTKQAFGMQNTQAYAKLNNLHEMVKSVRGTKEANLITPLIQKTVESLLDVITFNQQNEAELMVRYRNCHLVVLHTLQDSRLFGVNLVNKEVTKTLTSHSQDMQYNVEIVELLIRAHLLDLEAFDANLAQSMERGMNYSIVGFAFKLLKALLVDDKPSSPVSETVFYHTLEVLGKLTAVRRDTLPPSLPALLDTIKNNYDQSMEERQRTPGATQVMHQGLSRVIEHERRVQKLALLMGISRKKAKEYDDPPSFNEKVEMFMREWINIYHSPAAGRDTGKGFSNFVRTLQHQKILNNEDLVNRFFRSCTEMFVEMTYKLLQDTNINQALVNPSMVRSKCFHFLDAYVRLIVLMIKWPSGESSPTTRIHFLNRILGVIIGVLIQDHETRSTDFHQMPYQRILIMLFFELTAPEHFLESLHTHILTAFTNAFHLLRPAKAPGFAFAWLELVAYRGFLSRMLSPSNPTKNPAGPVNPTCPMYSQLLIDLFKFLSPFLRNVEVPKSIEVLYRGSLRLILVLLHDFPEFLCSFHYTFCDVIPANCIQLRNLILSAFPRNMRLPDPFTPNLKVDLLQEINQPPLILSNICSVMPKDFHNHLDSYLTTRAPVTFLSELRSILQISNEPGVKYNIPLINSLVLYVGVQAISHLQNKGATSSMGTITHSSHMDIFQNLSVDLDTEGRYLFLNAIANQLRYPNSHTHYFSCTLLYLFAEANQEAIQEQITRVLLERLIVNRPHPWGLLITFIELIKNPTFKFWQHDFVKCAPEITKLFDSVARSCTGKQFNQAGQPGVTAPTDQTVATSSNGTIPSQNVAMSS